MRFGVVVPSYGRYGNPELLLRLIRTAERLGYEGAWFADHVVVPDYAVSWMPSPQLEPLTCCLIAMGATERIHLGVDVLVAPYRNAVLLAKMAASADGFGPGRLVLGIGVGYLEGEFDALGIPYETRGAMTDEYLEFWRHVWSTPDPVAFRGTFVDVEAVHLAVKPAAGGVPLWVGGNIDRALRRAAVLGDGWHPLWPTPERYRSARAHITELREAGGIDRPFTFSFSCPAGSVLDRPRTDWEVPAPVALARPEYGYSPSVPRAPDGRPRFTGTVEQLIEDVELFAEAGVEHLTLRFWTSAADRSPEELEVQLERFATEVVPHCS
ncbi:MAG: class F420-dependent oxidoreductase [Actinomycetia bacterium]|nr:class F420-dependent oxidoreductase [Actinomycetes bacterium]